MPLLFPTTIPRVSWLHDFGEVPVENGSFASYVRDPTGREWVCKLEENTGWQPILAEALGLLLGRRLGALVPDGALYEGEGGRAWLSARVPLAGHWSADHRDAVHNLAELGAMLALDALLFNEDRHSGNILLQPDPDLHRLRAWAIDMGGATVGHIEDFIQRGLQPPDPYNHARGLPLPSLEAAALSAADRSAQIERAELEDMATTACSLVQEPSGQPLAEALRARCRSAPALVAGYLDRLRGLR